MSSTYEFRIAGRVSQELLSTFEPAAAHHDHGETVIVCAVGDDSEMFGVISRCETFGLHLVSVREISDDVTRQSN